MNIGVARRTAIAFVAVIALPFCAAQAQPRPGFGGPGWGGGWHGGWGGGWAGAPFLGGALLGLGLGLLPYYAAPPPAYYPPAYYPPPVYYPSPGYYPYAYGYAPPAYRYSPPTYAPGYYGYATPPQPYVAPQGYTQQGYYAARDPNNCGTPDEPKPCARH